MRILNLRFKNLNSLAGEWNIDFNDPAFVSEGIFTITGPTGAGKSTILDAICLGLFGRTPRLEKINESSNEIMSCRTGECFSEVTFAVPLLHLPHAHGEHATGIFQTHWYQHRAGKKETGRLQPYSFELADMQTGSLITSDKSKVTKEIERLTGMDFKRFTRSMMLAQGGFAAFLQANADERSPLLEQITGTEIYTEISKLVHKKTSFAENSLKEHENIQSQLNLLSEQEVATILAEKNALLKEEKRRSEQLDQDRKDLIRLQSIAQLKKDIKEIEDKQVVLEREKKDFFHNAKRLEKAKKAQGFALSYNKLTALRNSVISTKQELSNLEKILPELKEAETNAEIVKKNILHEQKTAFEEQERMALLFRHVRDIDQRLLVKKEAFATTRDEGLAFEKRYRGLSDQKNALHNEMITKQKDLDQCRATMNLHTSDANLVEQFTGIKARLTSLKKLVKEATDKKNDALALKDKRVEAANQLAALNKDIASKNTLLHKEAEELTLISESLHALLDGSTYEQLLEEKYRQETSRKSFDNALAIIQSMSHLLSKIEEAASGEKTLQEQIEKNTAAKKEMITQCEFLAKEQNLLEKHVSLIARIASLEEERKHLVKGEPCPLCGSLEHPLAAGVIQEQGDAKNKLDEVRNRLKQKQSEFNELEKKLAAGQVHLQHSKNDKLEAEQQYKKLAAEVNAFFSEKVLQIEPYASLDEKKVILQTQVNSTQKRLDSIGEALQKAQILNGSIKKQQKYIDEQKSHIALTEKEIRAVEIKEQQLALRVDEAIIASDKIFEQVRLDVLDMQEELLSPYGVYDVSAYSTEKVDRILAELERRKDRWLALAVTEKALMQDVTAISLQVQGLERTIAESKASLESKQVQVKKMQEELDKEQKTRFDLFENQNVDAEEQRQKERMITVEGQVKKAEDRCIEVVSKLRDTLRDQDTIQKKWEGFLRDVAHEEATFLSQIIAAGFVDESAYTMSLLTASEQEQLEAQEQSLAKKAIELTTLYREKKERLCKEQEEKQERENAPSPEQLEEKISVLDSELGDLRKSLGSLEQKIANNEDKKKQNLAELALLNALRKEAEKWRRLHLLIGSADGKKFRNYAQGLTFEIMVAHANMQLQKMSDRYFLSRDKALPLELNVIDTYQAGEERSTRNLSGGESFIISLALALGLSNMASGVMRVDSLFLDEGFGALDEDTLEIALDTLAGLRQEGKLIGLISHMEALKERINLQLEVKPASNGKSIIIGQGCSALS